MEQPGGQPLPGGFAYGSGSPSGAQPPRPGGMMLPNGQPPRPGQFMPMQQQRPPFPAQMAPPQPPMNGMPTNPTNSNQPRPPNQPFPPQSFAPQYGPQPPKLNGPQINYPQPTPPPGGFQQYGPPSQPNGLQPSGPQSIGQYPPHMQQHQQQQQFSRATFPPSGSFPQMSAQGPPPRGPLPPHSVGPAGDAHTPPRGSPLPPTAGMATPREPYLLPLPRGFLELPPRCDAGTPNTSEPVSAQSSRNPSPLPAPRYDQMEGQFPPGQQQSTSKIYYTQQPQVAGPSFNSPRPSMPPQQYQQQQPPSMPPLPQPPPMGQSSSMPPLPQPPPMGPPSSMPPLSHPPLMGQPPSMPALHHPPQGGQSPYMSPQPHPAQSPPHMPPPMHQHQEHPAVHLPPQPQQQHPGMPPMPSQVPQPRRPQPITQDQSSHMSKRYPAQTGYSQPTNNAMDGLSSQMGSMSVTQSGFNKLWGMDSYDLMQMRNILPPDKVEPPKISLHQTLMESANCSPDIFRCTLTKIPETSSLLQKSRLPLGILIHPFKDLSQLPVIQCNTIVRCRACRTYINPFVYFVDHRRWKCNLCFRVNELPEEFQYDPVSKTYGDPSRRPEIKSATIEFIAPSEYMLRPPQPAVYLFVLEVSRAAAESGYLRVVCETLLEELERLPGDARTQIGFLTFDSALHFYGLGEGLSQPHMMIVGDIDDVFLPCPDNLLVNLHESRELIKDLLTQLPSKFVGSVETGSALGPALQASFKLMAATGGRVTVFQVSLPSCGPGALQTRGIGGAKDSSPLLNPATDFYKRLALDCSGQQIAVDLFLLNSQYADLASLSGISRYSGGCIYHFPDFSGSRPLHTESLERSFRRYLTRKIGFEAVMRVRCTRGLGIHTFHGNFFVRSTDLLSLPNVNPDAGFGMQVSIEENLSDVQNVCFQAALLYTSSKGERRIRVHTLCLPIAANVADILTSADQQCIVGLLAKMAVDRSQMSSLSDARDAFINVAVDVLSIYRTTQTIGGSSSGLLAPHCLRLLPLFIVALLKHAAFRSGQNVRVDDRLFAMCQMKSLPLVALMQSIYPDLYPVHYLTDEGALEVEGRLVPQPPRVHLSAEKLDSRGLFLLDTGERLLMYAGRNIAPELCQAVLGVPAFEAIPDDMMELPELESSESQRLRNFVTYLQTEKPFPPTLQVIREDSKHRGQFIQYLLEDRSESALSYYEFLQHLKSQVK